MSDFDKDNTPEGQVKIEWLKFEGARCSLCDRLEEERLVRVTGKNTVQMCQECICAVSNFSRVMF